MTGFLFAFIAVVLAGVGARDQITVAKLASGMGQRPALLAIAIALSISTAAFAAWLSVEVSPWLAPPARMLFGAIALGLAGLESLVLSPGRTPQEPTRSLAAIALVLLAHQLTDAARFIIFGIALATGAAMPAGAGGALGGVFVLGAAWGVPELFDRGQVRLWRRGTGALLLMAALGVGITGLG